MRNTRGRRRILAQAALVAATLFVTARGSAQPTSAYDEEIATIRGLIEEFESGRTMIVASNPPSGYGWFLVVPRERAGDIGGWMVISGQLHPDSVASWTRQQLALSRGAVEVMKQQIVQLESRRIAPPPPPAGNAAQPAGVASFPVPMDWREVRGFVRGTYSIQCYHLNSTLPPIRGTFYLELRGRGIVAGSFTDTDERTMQEMNGEISDSGLANGGARSTNATTGWSARFVRAGNALKVENPQFSMVPFGDGARCDPGVIQPQ